MSTPSLNSPRVSISATINSDIDGIKRLLADFFTGAKLFAKIHRTDDGITTAIIQGHPKQFPSSLEYLKGLLLLKYDAAIVWGDSSLVTEKDRFDSITIEDTEPGLKREPSSGFFQEFQLDEISFGGSATTENLKKIAKDTFITMSKAARGLGVAQGLIPATKKEHISVKHNGRKFDFEVSTIPDMEKLIQAVQKKFQLAVPITALYRLDDGDNVVVTDVSDLRDSHLYYVQTVNEGIFNH